MRLCHWGLIQSELNRVGWKPSGLTVLFPTLTPSPTDGERGKRPQPVPRGWGAGSSTNRKCSRCRGLASRGLFRGWLDRLMGPRNNRDASRMSAGLWLSTAHASVGRESTAKNIAEKQSRENGNRSRKSRRLTIDPPPRLTRLVVRPIAFRAPRCTNMSKRASERTTGHGP